MVSRFGNLNLRFLADFWIVCTDPRQISGLTLDSKVLFCSNKHAKNQRKSKPC